MTEIVETRLIETSAIETPALMKTQLKTGLLMKT